ncbi:MAG: SRPBCC family protein [Actinobacteria bacterium]|nr:SRPBCC family protein [Actinomycetota bacterium]
MSAVVVVTRTVSAEPSRVFSMVSDLARMGEWSPENQGGEWANGASGPTVGARFRGRNSNGKRSWRTVVEVNAFEPGRRISFGLMVGPKNWCDWVWEVRPVEGGTEVRHEWIDHRGKVAVWLGNLVSGVKDRAAHNRRNMEATLDALVKSLG